MTLINPPLMVTGGIHPARAMRMMIRDLSRGSQGITEGGDLKVSALTTPGPGVRVGPGSAVIRGAAWGQGSYTQANAGDTVVPIAPTSARDRIDLIVLRIEDPEYEGNRDPAKDDIGYIQVISDVSRGALTVPPGMTAIPLAWVWQPPNCQTVTSNMINDLRQLANPRRDRRLQTITSFTPSELPAQSGVWQSNWPPNAAITIDVPPWATLAHFVTTLTGLRVWGETYIGFRNLYGGNPLTEFKVDTDTITSASRVSQVCADVVFVQPAHRGTRQELRLQAGRYLDIKGGCNVDGATAFVFDVEFVEGVR
ncbi:hypothetical protein E6W39_29235 [Kitasatospora acidiphila]|uniref:Uncharacterized protein n=1 Tax=Kitasatospora acidiphila TaxID=2567942 RepID=A0A540W970_9ACTN|nr:hypothetical protein [Kitasatospora acidiphila]TQF05569.1 hypothetical protein E6W39_29235 [Kitasatospora acidiphila]